MRTISGYQAPALGALACLGAAASAQDQDALSQPILIPSQSSVFNQNSVNLPSAPSVSGQDIVRGADGTTCQSAVASGGPYLDVGVLQSQDFYARDTAALYGRVVFPLGKRGKRLDCTRLYQLEIERMRMELELLRLGTSFGDVLAVGEDARAAEVAPEPQPVGGVVVRPPTQASAPPMQLAYEEPAPAPEPQPEQIKKTSASTSFYFVQAGAFSEASIAAERLEAISQYAGRDDGTLKPLTRRGETLFRALVGPMPREEAENLCTDLPWDCFVAQL
ncbi:MAG: SPOR domain-containing protein [Pseudomonadota bacterium]